MTRFRDPLLFTGAGLLLANAVFASVVSLAWPARNPAWANRVISAVFLLGVVLAALAALGYWRERKRKQGPVR